MEIRFRIKTAKMTTLTAILLAASISLNSGCTGISDITEDVFSQTGTTAFLIESNGNDENVRVPLLTGKTFDDAEKILSDLSLKIGITVKEYSDDTDRTVIVSQDPSPDELVQIGCIIYVKVKIPQFLEENTVNSDSTDNMIKVPLLTGRTFDESEKLLKQMNLKIDTETIGYSGDITSAVVVSQDPPADKTVAPGTVICVKIKEPYHMEETKPEVTGKETGQVTAALSEAEQEDLIRSALTDLRQDLPYYTAIAEILDALPSGFDEKIQKNIFLNWIKEGFLKYPPHAGSDPERELLFTGMDVLTAIDEDTGFSYINSLDADDTRSVFNQIISTAESEMLIIYKLYNEGVIIAFGGTYVGIDIVLPAEDNDLAKGFAKLLDCLLVTHTDMDHRDYVSDLHRELNKAGKTVVVLDDVSSKKIGEEITSGKTGDVVWTGFKGGHLDLRFSGFFLLTLGNKWKILHSGDNTRWLDFAATGYAEDIDVFLFKPESRADGEGYLQGRDVIAETLELIHPRILIPHHLLEFGHGLGAYGHDMGIRLIGQSPQGVDVVMLNWGESIKIE
jgi:beta-lactam-binding protein with PASTA domain